MQEFHHSGNKICFEIQGVKATPVIVWAHGWGQNHKAFLPIAESLSQMGRHILIDFPGFGGSPVPDTVWGTADYADAIAALLRSHGVDKVIWVGHSFGCRVGVQIAARHPDLIAGLFLIAAAGLPRKRPLAKKLYLKARIYSFKFLKRLVPMKLVNREWLLKTFASPDYASAGALRPIFVKTVNEDLTDLLPTIQIPVKLVFGSRDTETPPELGHRMRDKLPKADLMILDGQDHYTILGEGRHPVVQQLKKFIETLS